MGFARFIRLWLWGAIKRSVGLGDFIAGIAGNVITVFVHFYPSYEAAMNDLLWQIPLYGLAGAMAWRLVVTPYELWRDAEERAQQHTGSDPVKEAYDIQAATEKAKDDAAHRRKMREAFPGLLDAFVDGAKDRQTDTKAEREIRKRRKIRDALKELGDD